jgi:hypothetical protein
MIDRDHKLSIMRQASLLNISRTCRNGFARLI